MKQDVLNAAKEFGCEDAVMALFRDMPEDVQIALVPTRAANYISVAAAPDEQVAIYVHRSAVYLALDPEEAQRVASAAKARLTKKTPRTWYVRAKDKQLGTLVVRDAAHSSLARVGKTFPPGDPDDALYTGKDAVCPVHWLVMPVSGLCDDCD